MAMEEVKISLHLILKVGVADDTGDALVTAFAAEEAAIAEKEEVDMVVVAAGGQNPIFPPDNTLTRNGRFLAAIKRARYLLSAINMNHAIQMRSRYRNSQLLRLPRLRLDRTLVWQLKGIS